MRSFPSLLFISFFLASSVASALQLPVPVTPSNRLRIAVDPHLTTDFAGVNRAELYIDFTHAITKEFEWGLSAHGGAASSSIFGNQSVSPVLGGDLMLRYFGSITDVFHLGLQVDVLYTHKFIEATVPNALGFRLSVPFAVTFESAVGFFLSPAIQFEGQVYTDRYGPASLWGRGPGMGISTGFVVYTSGPGIFIAARPTWGDVRRFTEVTADFNLGLVFDF